MPYEVVVPLIRGVAVLREIAAHGGRRSVGDLVRATGLARSTVDRALSTVAEVGYLRLEGKDAVLTPRIMELGNAYLAASRLPDGLGPLADALADDLDESVSLAVPDRDGIRFVHQAIRRRAMSLTFRIGDFLPADRTAAGAVFTAKARGWALDDQLIEPGLIAIAMAVRDVCAVSVVSHTSRHSAASLRDAVLPRLRETAAAMERALATAGAFEAGSPAVAPARTSKQELGRHFVESLARGLSVITAFDSDHSAPTLTCVATATGLARATAGRALATLEHLGYVESAGRQFRLTPRVLELGFAHLSEATLPAIARPHLVSLGEAVRESASMAVLSGDDIQYVARVPTVRIMSVNITVGTRFPAYATSMGRVLLAGLPPGQRAARLDRDLAPLTPHTVTDPRRLSAILDEVARNGFALVDQELEEGLRSLAVPVRDREGRVVAAINVSTHASRHTASQAVAEFLAPLRAAAAHIEHDLHVAGRYARIRP